ncbi:MAG: hypothetical protein J6P98_05925, partial [Clostridia bacterium]|nr:hypothetical protein [Clostridia bacterium]
MIKRTVSILLCLFLAAGSLYALRAMTPSEAYGEGTAPGSADDPVVTKSYVDLKLHEQQSALSERIDGLGGRISSLEENATYSGGSEGGSSGSESSSDHGSTSGSGSSSGQSGAEDTADAAKLAELEKYM